MHQPKHAPFDLISLMLGLYLGVLGNLVTGDPDDWWTPFQWIPDVAGYLFWSSVLVIAGMWGWRWSRTRRIRHWRSDLSPYAGLQPYDADRTQVFFGRDGEIAEILKGLRHQRGSRAGQVISIVGPSGSGKSSLLRAGVLPRLAPTQWSIVAPFRPGGDPFRNLAWGLSSTMDGTAVDPHRLNQQARILRQEGNRARAESGYRPENFAASLRVARGNASRILLPIDQCEELITRSTVEERDSFLALLKAAVSTLPEVSVVLTVRTEYRDAFGATAWPELLERPFPVTSLGPRQLREAITRPAEAAGLTFDTGLVDVIVADSTMPGALPLLSHLLEAVSAGRRHITNADYDRVGRVAGAITKDADRSYDELRDVHGTDTVDAVLLDFLAWSGDTAVIREVERTSLSDVAAEIVAVLQDTRLVSVRRDGVTCALAHDALLTQWSALARLIAEHRDDLMARQRIEDRAAAWTAEGRPSDDVLTGRSLVKALALSSSLSSEVVEFIAESRRVAADEAMRGAERAADFARQHRFSSPGLAVALARAAVEQAPTSQLAQLTLWGLTTEPTIDRFALGHTGKVTSIIWLDDERFRTASVDGSICTWDSNGKLIGFTTIPGVEKGESLLSADGSRIATVYRDRVVLRHVESGVDYATGRWSARVSDLAWAPDGERMADVAGRGVRILDGPREDFGIPLDKPASGVWWSLDARHLALVSGDAVVIMRVSDGCELAKLPLVGLVWCVAWSSDDRCALVVAPMNSFGTQEILVWDWRHDGSLDRWSVPRTRSLVWSRDGRQLYGVVSDDQAQGRLSGVTSWEVESGLESGYWEGDYGMGDLSLSPNGARLAVVDSVVVNVLDCERLRPLIRTLNAPTRMCLSPDRTRLAVSASREGRLRVHGPTVDDGRLEKYPNLTGQPVWSPNGAFMASEHFDRDERRSWIVIHNATTLRTHAIFNGNADTIGGIVWSPDSSALAVTIRSSDSERKREVVVCSVANGKTRVVMDKPASTTGPLVWSPDGSHLASAIAGGAMCLWTSAAGELVRTVELGIHTDRHSRAASIVGWSPDGDRIAVVIAGTVLLVDATTWEATVRFTEHSGDVQRLCWSPDSRRVASIGYDKMIRLWRATDGRQEAIIDVARSVSYEDLAWSADGQSIMLTTGDNRLRTWTLPDLADPSSLISGTTVDYVLTDADHQRFGLAVSPVNPTQLFGEVAM
ncbi:hypothetical protein [Stackebrandtia soli]|uniref:nSTAND1 domain-containing NTPase n=1 Tax=Stackebrandtia soli TaxID=1892856 RepID=UPI0039E88CA5